MAENDPLKRATRDLVAHSAELVNAHRFDPLIGQVWTALFLAGASRTRAQVADFVDQPADEVAAALAQLVELGLARAGGDRFETEADPLLAVARFMRQHELPLLAETEESLRYAGDELTAVGTPDAKRAAERLDALARQIGLLRGLLDRLTAAGALDLAALARALARS